jgi:hypothetical protein
LGAPVGSELEFHFGDDPVSEAAGSVVAGAKVVVPPAVDGIVTSSDALHAFHACGGSLACGFVA